MTEKLVAAILGLIVALVLSFGLTAAFLWALSLFLPFTFSWIKVLGLWVILAALKQVLVYLK